MFGIRKNVLVADGSAEVRAEIIRQISAQDSNVNCLEASSAQDCRIAFLSGAVDFALIAAQLGDQDGFALIESSRDISNLPLSAVMVEQFTPAIRKKALELPVYDCVAKPLSVKDTKRLLKKCEMHKIVLSALIVDRAPAVRRIIYKLLGESQFKLTLSEVDDGKMAKALCKAIPFHFLFVDPDTPGWQGQKSAAKILKRQPNCRIVLTSAKKKSVLLAEHGPMGISGILKKPFYPEDITRLLHGLLGMAYPNLQNDSLWQAKPQTTTKKREPQVQTASVDNVDQIWI